MADPTPVNHLQCNAVKEKLLFWQIIWLLQLGDYPSCANSKNVVLVKHFVGGQCSLFKYHLLLHYSHPFVVTKYLAKISHLFLQ